MKTPMNTMNIRCCAIFDDEKGLICPKVLFVFCFSNMGIC